MPHSPGAWEVQDQGSSISHSYFIIPLWKEDGHGKGWRDRRRNSPLPITASPWQQCSPFMRTEPNPLTLKVLYLKVAVVTAKPECEFGRQHLHHGRRKVKRYWKCTRVLLHDGNGGMASFSPFQRKHAYLEVTPSLKMAGDQLFLGQLCPKSTYLTHTKDLYSSDKKNRFVLVLV